MENRDAFEVEAGPGVFIDAKASATNLPRPEARLCNILPGYQVTTAVEDDFGDDAKSTEVVVSVGWVPISGLAITASTQAEDNTTTDDKTATTGTAETVAWLF